VRLALPGGDVPLGRLPPLDTATAGVRAFAGAAGGRRPDARQDHLDRLGGQPRLDAARPPDRQYADTADVVAADRACARLPRALPRLGRDPAARPARAPSLPVRPRGRAPGAHGLPTALRPVLPAELPRRLPHGGLPGLRR